MRVGAVIFHRNKGFINRLKKQENSLACLLMNKLYWNYHIDTNSSGASAPAVPKYLPLLADINIYEYEYPLPIN